jgi:hypothetical protein
MRGVERRHRRGLRGRVMEYAMGTLVFVCPATGEEVSTGIEMDLATLSQLDVAKVYCPHCRQPQAAWARLPATHSLGSVVSRQTLRCHANR